jgi:hypothetical protein
MWDRDVIDHVVERFGGPTNTDDPNDEPDDDGPDDDEPDDDEPDDDEPRDNGPDDEDPDDEGPDDGGADDRPTDDRGPDAPSPEDHGPEDHGPEDHGPEDHGPEDHAPADDEPGAGQRGDGGSAAGRPRQTTAPSAEDISVRGGRHEQPSPGPGPGPADADAASATSTSGAAADAEEPWRVAFVPRVALRVGLATVLGLDRRAGALPGHGVVTNSVAVAMAWNRAHSTIRLLLYDPDGHLEYALTARPPRRGQPPPHADQRRHHIVELTAHTGELEKLAAALGDPQLALHGDPPPGGILIHGDALDLLQRAASTLAAARARPIEEHPAHTHAEDGNRFPSAALRTWVQARDQTCRSPGCAADAAGCDIDHTRPVTEGGLTRAEDLGPFCRRDHTFKHDPDTGWTVTQTHPGRFAWTSPTGRVHIKTPEPYTPGPGPIPRTDDDHTDLPGHTPDAAAPPTPPPGSPRRNTHGYLTQAAIDTAARLRERARENPEADPEAEPNPNDRFPEEPPF